MTGIEDALRGAFGEDVVPDRNRVEDTRTLKPGDPVRVVIDTVVSTCGPDELIVGAVPGRPPAAGWKANPR